MAANVALISPQNFPCNATGKAFVSQGLGRRRNVIRTPVKMRYVAQQTSQWAGGAAAGVRKADVYVLRIDYR